jgi:hypothetical protein
LLRAANNASISDFVTNYLENDLSLSRMVRPIDAPLDAVPTTPNPAPNPIWASPRIGLKGPEEWIQKKYRFVSNIALLKKRKTNLEHIQ